MKFLPTLGVLPRGGRFSQAPATSGMLVRLKKQNRGADSGINLDDGRLGRAATRRSYKSRTGTPLGLTRVCVCWIFFFLLVPILGFKVWEAPSCRIVLDSCRTAHGLARHGASPPTAGEPRARDAAMDHDCPGPPVPRFAHHPRPGGRLDARPVPGRVWAVCRYCKSSCRSPPESSPGREKAKRNLTAIPCRPSSPGVFSSTPCLRKRSPRGGRRTTSWP